MKILFLLISLVALSTQKCNKGKITNCFKGRLEIKGICNNYTIKLLEGDPGKSLYMKSWTDEISGKNYSNVFALGNPCSFPSTLNQGDEFFFTIQESATEDCVTCRAYAPKPSKAINIKVLSQSCK